MFQAPIRKPFPRAGAGEGERNLVGVVRYRTFASYQIQIQSISIVILCLPADISSPKPQGYLLTPTYLRRERACQ